MSVIEIVPTVYEDDRGVFVETFQRERYRALGIDHEFVQDNFSRSSAGTLRGLHYQLRQPQGKLVWVTHGEVFDVAVDLRRGPGFGTHHACVLSGFRQVWIPPGFAHGFLVLSETAHVAYKVTAPYDPSDQHSLRWDDPQLAIAWPITTPPRLSEKDRTAPRFAEAVL